MLLGGAAVAVAEEPLSVAYGPARPHGRRRRRLPRDHLLPRCPRRPRTACICGCSTPTSAAPTTPATVPAGTRACATRVYGGAGAAAAERRPRVPRDGRGGRAAAAPPGRGASLGRRSPIGEDAALDDAWRTLASFMPAQGDRVDGRYVFRLEVAGLAGDDGNTFAPTLSLRDRRNVAPPGLEILDYAPTVRIPDEPPHHGAGVRRTGRRRSGSASTISTLPPAESRSPAPFRTVELPASAQDGGRRARWRSCPTSRGPGASIIVAGGDRDPE